MSVINYEDVRGYPIDPDVETKILTSQNEATLAWTRRDGWPVGAIMSYVWRDGAFWLTASSQRPRVAAIRRDDRVSVVVSSVGTSLGPAKAITYKGRCVIREDRATKDWFYPALAAAILPGDERTQRAFVRMLDSPRRVILEVTPESSFSFDAMKMMEASLFGSE